MTPSSRTAARAGRASLGDGAPAARRLAVRSGGTEAGAAAKLDCRGLRRRGAGVLARRAAEYPSTGGTPRCVPHTGPARQNIVFAFADFSGTGW
ncbi:hypothetical protein NO135_20890, partial [Clostridioides difficile]|nr:hypothetical protein [Clostridioides difficile]